MKNSKKILNILFLIALSIVSLIFITNFITILGWLFKISITSFSLIISFVLNSLLVYFLQKKVFNLGKKEYFYVIIGVIMIMLIALMISVMFMDVSYDGSWYHLTSIIRMKEGWNPLYESVNTNHYWDVYIDSYANKSVWSFSACCYKLFNNMNVTKMFSTMLAFSTCLLSISIFFKMITNKKIITKLSVVAVCILLAFNPIYVEQMFTNYIDSSLGLLVISYILLFIAYYLKQYSFKDNIFKYYLIILISTMANVKLTGLFFAGIFFFIFMIIPMFKSLKNKKIKEFKSIFMTGFVGVMLVLLIGANPYITNIIRGHNIFYPIFGTEKIEVMGANVPEIIRNRSNLEKIILVNSMDTTNSVSANNMQLLNPFTLDISSYKNMANDTRVGSFGKFSIIAMIILIIFSFINFKYLLKPKNNTILLIFILAVILVALVFSESWWGRYYPELFLIPCFLILYNILSNKRMLRVVGYISICLLVINIGLIFGQRYIYNYNITNQVNKMLPKIKDKSIIFASLEVSNPNYCQGMDLFSFPLQKFFDEKEIDATSICSTKNNISNYNWDYNLVNMSVNVINNE